MELIWYTDYKFRIKDWLEYVFFIIGKAFLICLLFYDSYKGIFILLPVFLFEYRQLKSKKIIEQKRQLTLQFKDMMEALVTSLNAGYSLEHAFRDAKKDLELIYEANSYIFYELDIIITNLKRNIPIEKLLLDFGRRSDIEDIDNFARVVVVAKKSGGNLIRIIQKTVRSISEKISVEEEINTLITAKKLEQKIMMVMPYLIILYLRMTNGNYFDVLYHNPIGAGIMTIFLLLIYVADWWAKKITEIKI